MGLRAEPLLAVISDSNFDSNRRLQRKITATPTQCLDCPGFDSLPAHFQQTAGAVLVVSTGCVQGGRFGRRPVGNLRPPEKGGLTRCHPDAEVTAVFIALLTLVIGRPVFGVALPGQAVGAVPALADWARAHCDEGIRWSRLLAGHQSPRSCERKAAQAPRQRSDRRHGSAARCGR